MLKIFKHIKDLVLPQICAACRRFVQLNSGDLCPTCWSKLKLCSKTLIDLSVQVKDIMRTLYGHCPTYYHGTIKLLIKQFKHGDDLSLRHFFTKLLIKHFPCPRDFKPDYLVPIPIHWRRLFYRTYNQSVILSRSLSHLTHIPTAMILHRSQFSKMQRGLNPKQRIANVNNTMAIAPEMINLTRGKKILLIDDVVTSGATLITAAQVLLEAGAAQVRFLVLSQAQAKSKS